MNLPLSTVAVFEPNRTRAELYGLWLEEAEVRVAATKREADDNLDDRLGVAVLDQAFADGEADTLLDIITSRAPFCRVIATRERSATFPDLGVDHQLVKPVFEAELVEMVEKLLLRANYHFALRLYYQSTISLSSLEINEDEPDTDQEESLKRRIARLQKIIKSLAGEMTSEDIVAVKHSLTLDDQFPQQKSEEKIDNKYRPSKCSQCGIEWDFSSSDTQVTQLGAYVWRCGVCGHVQMGADPSHRQIGSYRP